MPLGVFDRPADLPQVNSFKLPEGDVYRILENGTKLLNSLTELIPGQAFRWIQNRTDPP